MNAPTDTRHLDEPQVELLLLSNITPSETHVQAERRKSYSAAALDELAASLRESGGVLQPIVVRPLAALRGLAKYELVAGERRWRAAAKAGQEHILARILPLTDPQVLHAQLVENLQREGLEPLAEARGYRELMDQGVDVPAIMALIGKSRSYVYARLKLLDLAAPVQEALQAGELGADQALLFARLPAEKLQERALDVLRKWNYQGHGERLSFRRTAEIFRDKGSGLLLPLGRVPFKLDDPSFAVMNGKKPDIRLGQLPACTECHKRSGNDPELLAVLGDPDICTDRLCHDAKAKQSLERLRREAEASGREILKGEAAAAVLPTQLGTRGFVDLDAEVEDIDYPEPEPEQREGESDQAFEVRFQDWDHAASTWRAPSYRALLGEQVAQLDVKLAQDPRSGRLRELAPDRDVAKLLREQGHKVRIDRDTSKPEKPAKPKDPQQAKAEAKREAAESAKRDLEGKIDAEWRLRVLFAIDQAWKPPLKREDLELIAEQVFRDYEVNDALDDLWGRLARKGKRPTPATMSDRDIVRNVVVGILAAHSEYGRPGLHPALRAAAKRLKVDAEKIGKQVRAELAPKPEPAAAAKKKPAAAPKKKPAAKAKGKKK